jgi:hypothetical protein
VGRSDGRRRWLVAAAVADGYDAGLSSWRKSPAIPYARGSSKWAQSVLAAIPHQPRGELGSAPDECHYRRLGGCNERGDDRECVSPAGREALSATQELPSPRSTPKVTKA